MKCPHLGKWIIAECKAMDRPYVPSLFELEEYCRNQKYKRCPFFVNIFGAKQPIKLPYAV